MAPPELPAVSTRQRLCAARRLAAGDPLVLAAAYAGMTPEDLDRLQFDPDFTDLIDACRALHALDHAAWRARIELLMRDAVEDALRESRVSTLNTLLRACGLVRGEAAGGDMAPDAAAPPPDPVAARRRALLAGLPPDLRDALAEAPLPALEDALRWHGLNRRAAAAPDPLPEAVASGDPTPSRRDDDPRPDEPDAAEPVPANDKAEASPPAAAASTRAAPAGRKLQAALIALPDLLAAPAELAPVPRAGGPARRFARQAQGP